MKKFVALILCLICVLSLCACGNCRSEGVRVTSSSKYVDLEVVENTSYTIIYVDRNTGALYLWYKDCNNYGQAMTPLYNADGTLKNIEDFE